MNEWSWEIVAGPFGFTEGPVWDGSAVLFSDIPASRILRCDPKSGKCGVHITGTNEGNGLALARDGVLYGCQGGVGGSEGRRVVRYEASGDVTVIADHFEGRRLNSPNDLTFDERGRLWFTDPRYGDERGDMELDHESVYRADPDGSGGWSLLRVTSDTTRPNGLLVTPDCRTLYVAQSEYGVDRRRELRAYALSDDGSAGEHRVLHNFYPHRGIDGMCLDIEGNIVATAGWEASGPGPMIYVFAPNGRVLETHPVPFDRPTNCTWGGQNLDALYVTTGTGHLLRARPGRRGYLVYP